MGQFNLEHMTLYDEEGNEVEALTKEEAEAIQNPNEVLTELLKDLEVEKPEELKDKIAELKDSENPNWKEARSKIKSLESANTILKAQGKKINEKGEIVEENIGLSREEIIKEAKLSARQELLSEKINDSLSVYDEDQQKVIKHYYDKLSTGEEVTLANVDKFIGDAVRSADIKEDSDEAKKSLNGVGLRAVKTGGEVNNFADTKAGKGLLGAFGIPEPEKPEIKKDNK